MTTFQITAPARGFDGTVAGVHFSRGRAMADDGQDGAALGYFRRKGYTVVAVNEPEDTAQSEPTEPEDTAKATLGRPPRSEPKAIWQEYARGLARDSDEFDAIDDMTKDQLIERYGSEQPVQQGDDQK